ncbi:hypothetical protein [Mesorhizobium sp. M7A.F.Ce.TU.012.03.2.1]|uniref:hypothetical protein n=1 Tax=Mesorhizobium sp. M7A.F.Ce.TU.012.03.2.1 TaxID=2493681 RepID=UPI000FD9F416|nr:hypothetical protein [Mesorhizobium sp. M7A.F.Ce.TU.012.03.2.1]AZV17628.1 hypothetical protein EJ079_00100 [Mesorhizobium sp. M7A.F.Ce.TU.012.03.2.1]
MTAPATIGVANHEELALLQQVFQRACKERALAEGSVEAEALSARLMWLFQHSGAYFDEATFEEMLRGEG